MIELLKAQLQLAEQMARYASPNERSAWAQYHATITVLLEQLQRPPRVRPPIIRP